MYLPQIDRVQFRQAIVRARLSSNFMLPAMLAGLVCHN
jgi:hypothetical protein